MKVQYYNDAIPSSFPARMSHRGEVVARVFGESLSDVDKSLGLLGFRRDERWQKRGWGYEATIRRTR